VSVHEHVLVDDHPAAADDGQASNAGHHSPETAHSGAQTSSWVSS
jgi:hypothetical protein